MSPVRSLRKKLTPLQNIMKRKRRFIRCSSYVVAKRPAIIKDVLIRGTINTSAALAIYISEQPDSSAFNIGVFEGFFTESFEVQIAAMLFHLMYDIYYEYTSCTLNDEGCTLSYDDDEDDEP